MKTVINLMAPISAAVLGAVIFNLDNPLLGFIMLAAAVLLSYNCYLDATTMKRARR